MQMISEKKLGKILRNAAKDNLVNYINKMNEKTKARGAIGTLTNNPEHWAEYNVYTAAQLLDYLEREHQHNLRKDERRNQ